MPAMSGGLLGRGPVERLDAEDSRSLNTFCFRAAKKETKKHVSLHAAPEEIFSLFPFSDLYLTD